MTMKIQNPSMQGATLALPFAFDIEARRSVNVTLDEKGIVEVPDRDGEFLLGTPGWRIPLVESAPVSDGIALVSPEIETMIGEMLSHSDPAYAGKVARKYAGEARERGRGADGDALDKAAAQLESNAAVAEQAFAARAATIKASAPRPPAPGQVGTPASPVVLDDDDDGADESDLPEASLADQISDLTTRKDALAFAELRDIKLDESLKLYEMKAELVALLVTKDAPPAPASDAPADPATPPASTENQ